MSTAAKQLLLQTLVYAPTGNNPLHVMRKIHQAMTDKISPVSPENPCTPLLLQTYGAFVERGLRRNAFKKPDHAKTALAMTAELALLYPPCFKKFAAIGVTKKLLVGHLQTIGIHPPASVSDTPITKDSKTTNSKKQSRLGYDMPIAPARPPHTHPHFLDRPR